nr:pre-B-cell leukemia transcription factor 2 [Chrysemys picta bellii]
MPPPDPPPKHALNCHRMKPALFTVLCEIKEKTGRGVPGPPVPLRLGSPCLGPERGLGGVQALSIGPPSLCPTCRGAWAAGSVCATGPCVGVCYIQLVSTLRWGDPGWGPSHPPLRRPRYSPQSTCEAVMILRSRFLDARRKRRNFSKQATEVLNEYFYSHLSNPYPSEEAKEELAKKCGITISQVSNWFGNKRIRYKKNIGKFQEEANIYAVKTAVSVTHGTQSGGTRIPPPTVEPPLTAPPGLGLRSQLRNRLWGDPLGVSLALQEKPHGFPAPPPTPRSGVRPPSPVGLAPQCLPPAPQVESVPHSMSQGPYGEGLAPGQLYSPRDVRANGGWQEAATPSSVTSPTEGPGSVHSDTSN